jgi:hypothetical protein
LGQPAKKLIFTVALNAARGALGRRGYACGAPAGPDASRATKVVVSIIPAGHLEPNEMRDWQLVHGDVRKNPEIAAEMLAFMELHGAKSVVMSDGLMGCPNQTGIDYEGDWCPDPACASHGRDRFTHKLVQ